MEIVMPRAPRKPLVDEAPGLPSRKPVDALVRDRKTPREREKAQRRAMGFPPGRKPDEAIAPSCRCSDCDCPPRHDPDSRTLKGKELGEPTQPLWERMLTGAALGAPVKPWWERTVERTTKRRGPSRVPPPIPPAPLPEPPPVDRKGKHSHEPCNDLWADIIANLPVDDSGMPAVTRPVQLDFGDVPSMGGAFRWLGADYGLWYVANASFFYRLRVRFSVGNRTTPTEVQPLGRWRIPRCVDGEWVPVVPEFTMVFRDHADLAVFPAGLRAEQGLLVAELSNYVVAAPPVWTHHPPPDPAAFLRVGDDPGTTGAPDLPINGVNKYVRIDANEDFVVVSRGAAGVAVFAAPGSRVPNTVPWEFLGHQRMPLWGNDSFNPNISWGVDRLIARGLQIHTTELPAGLRHHLVVGFDRSWGPASAYPRAAVYDMTSPARFASSLSLDSLTPEYRESWWSLTEPGLAAARAEGSANLAGIVAFPMTARSETECADPSTNCQGVVGAMTATAAVAVGALPGTSAAQSWPLMSVERTCLAVSNDWILQVADITALVHPLFLPPPHDSSALPELVLETPVGLVLDELGSFAVSSGACGGTPSRGPGELGMADSGYPNLQQPAFDFATFCGRYLLTGWNATSKGNALHLLGMEYSDQLQTFRLRKIGEGRPRMDGPQTLESKARYIYDPITNVAFGSCRGRYGLAAFELPPQESADLALSIVGPDLFWPTSWYPEVDPNADPGCSPSSPQPRALTSSYRRLTTRQTIPWQDWQASGGPKDELPANMAASVAVAGFLGPDASSQPWMTEGFAYEFTGGAAAAGPDGSDVLFLTDRMGAALWAFEADPETSPALDVFGWLDNAQDVVTRPEGHAPGTALVIAAGRTDPGLLFLSWAWSQRRFVELGRLLTATGNFEDGSGPSYSGRVVGIIRLANLGDDPLAGQNGHHVVACAAHGASGPSFDTCHDYTDGFLFEPEPVVTRMAVAAGADHTNPWVAPGYGQSWWHDGGNHHWVLRPWWEPPANGSQAPSSWTPVQGGPLPWTRIGLGRDRVPIGDDKFHWATWLPGIDVTAPGGWHPGNAGFEDVAAYGDFAFVIVHMKGGYPANMPADGSRFWFLVLRKSRLDSLGQPLAEPQGAWCAAADGVSILRRGASGTGPLTKVDIPEWQVVGPPRAHALEPIVAIPLGSDADFDEASTIEVDPHGRYAVVMSGKMSMWVVYLGAPDHAHYGLYPKVVAGLRGDGAVQNESGGPSTWWRWKPGDGELNEELPAAATQFGRGNYETYPAWPLSPATPVPLDSIPGPPWRSAALARVEGVDHPLLFLNTAPMTAWLLSGPAEDDPDQVDANLAATAANPLEFLGAFCTHQRPKYSRDRVSIVSEHAVWFAGTGGALSIPLCGDLLGTDCCEHDELQAATTPRRKAP